MDEFLGITLGATEIPVHRLGLSATNRPGKLTIHRAIDAGVNYFFAYGFDRQMVTTLRDLFKREREKHVIATGAYNLLVGHQNLRRTLEKRLRQFRTDYIDVFMFLGVMKPKQFAEPLRDEMQRLREEGKVRFIGMSCHDRIFAGKLAEEGALDVFMIRYNAAHRGAEREIFPYVVHHNARIVAHDARSGRRVYQARFSAGGTCTASPVVANGKIYQGTEEGTLYVLAAGQEHKELAVHEFGTPLMATPAISEGLLLVRTPSELIALRRVEEAEGN